MSLNPRFNPYAAGQKLYGTGKHNPTEGPVDKTGYAARDRRRKVKLNALRAKIKAGTKGAFASSDYLR
jgi:hypothetical protein